MSQIQKLITAIGENCIHVNAITRRNIDETKIQVNNGKESLSRVLKKYKVFLTSKKYYRFANYK